MMKVNKSRLLKEALKEIMIPALCREGYAEIKKDRKDEIYRFGRVCKSLDNGNVIISAIKFDRYVPAFVVEFVESPPEGVIDDVAGNKLEQMEVWPGLNFTTPNYILCAASCSFKYFSARKFFIHSDSLEDYKKLVTEAASYLPEVGIAMREKRQTKHVKFLNAGKLKQ